MEAIGQLTGGLAHDFNNLLTVIIGNLELLEGKLPDDRTTKRLSEAIDAARKGAGLTRQMLAFARALGEFGATLMVAGSIAGKTQTLSIAVYEAVQAGQDDTANFLVAITSIVCVTVLLAAGRLVPGRVPARHREA